MKTDRMTLLMRREEKAELAARAGTMGISASELVRRAVQAYDPDNDLDELKALSEALADAVGRMESKLDATFEKIAAYEKALADRDGLRAAARAELEASGVVWPFSPPEREEPLGASS